MAKNLTAEVERRLLNLFTLLRMGINKSVKERGLSRTIPEDGIVYHVGNTPKLLKSAKSPNGKTGDVTTPWLHLDELFWDATAGRQVYAEIAFKQPTDVSSLTVHENPSFPDSWPPEGLVQAWDDEAKAWRTAAFGVHHRGPVNTYVPWHSYYRNFHTSEIEVR